MGERYLASYRGDEMTDQTNTPCAPAASPDGGRDGPP